MELFNVCFDSFVQQLPGFNPDTAVLCYREVMGRKGLEQLPAASSLRKSLGGSKRAGRGAVWRVMASIGRLASVTRMMASLFLELSKGH